MFRFKNFISGSVRTHIHTFILKTHENTHIHTPTFTHKHTHIHSYTNTGKEGRIKGSRLTITYPFSNSYVVSR